jgi:hypothetical protein
MIPQATFFCLVAVLAMLCDTAIAQRASASFGGFVALLESGERVEGGTCIVSAEGLSGVTSAGVRISAPLSSVKSLFVTTGSEAGRFALLGGACGLGIGLAAILTVESQGNGNVNYSNIGVLVAAGAVIGAVLGAGQHSWEKVDLDLFRRPSGKDSTNSRQFR